MGFLVVGMMHPSVVNSAGVKCLDKTDGGGGGAAIDVQTEGTNAVARVTGEGCNPDLNYCCNKVAGA